MNRKLYRILTVEDNESIRKALKKGLELEGFEVCAVDDGLKALTSLKQPPLPDVILLDLLLPVMTGFEFLKEIKKDPTKPVAKIPILVVSAVANKSLEIKSQVQGIFEKPFDFDELVEAIRRFCPVLK